MDSIRHKSTGNLVCCRKNNTAFIGASQTEKLPLPLKQLNRKKSYHICGTFHFSVWKDKNER